MSVMTLAANRPLMDIIIKTAHWSKLCGLYSARHSVKAPDHGNNLAIHGLASETAKAHAVRRLNQPKESLHLYSLTQPARDYEQLLGRNILPALSISRKKLHTYSNLTEALESVFTIKEDTLNRCRALHIGVTSPEQRENDVLVASDSIIYDEDGVFLFYIGENRPDMERYLAAELLTNPADTICIVPEWVNSPFLNAILPLLNGPDFPAWLRQDGTFFTSIPEVLQTVYGIS